MKRISHEGVFVFDGHLKYNSLTLTRIKDCLYDLWANIKG